MKATLVPKARAAPLQAKGQVPPGVQHAEDSAGTSLLWEKMLGLQARGRVCGAAPGRSRRDTAALATWVHLVQQLHPGPGDPLAHAL